MNKRELTLLYSYLYNNRIRLENEVKQLQQNVRYRRVDIVDCMELACALERLNTFTEASQDIRALLNLNASYDEKNGI